METYEFTAKTEHYTCPVHGEITSIYAMTLTLNGDVYAHLCTHCYFDWLKANVSALTPAKP